MKGEIIVITGMSGAGKTTAIDYFEDLGYFCIDNVPPDLLYQFVELLSKAGKGKLAVVVDIRSGGTVDDINDSIMKLRKSNFDVKLLFLDSSDEFIIRRYAFTRRPHPFLSKGLSLEEAIKVERTYLQSLKERADIVIDTSGINIYEFREILDKLIFTGEKTPLTLNFVSFGFKHGIPMTSDVVIDTRFLPNPYYEDSLKDLTGIDQKIAEFFEKFQIVGEYYKKTFDFLRFVVENYNHSGKTFLTISIGCTGGKHRSVYFADKLAKDFKKLGYRVLIKHRDLEES
ncbi:MAG: RNase adapter RapZ [Thermotogae bacterium]|nr:RNase adapter RapZ [Thermotogota bacterium]